MEFMQPKFQWILVFWLPLQVLPFLSSHSSNATLFPMPRQEPGDICMLCFAPMPHSCFWTFFSAGHWFCFFSFILVLLLFNMYVYLIISLPWKYIFLWANGSEAANEGWILTAQPVCLLAVDCHLEDNLCLMGMWKVLNLAEHCNTWCWATQGWTSEPTCFFVSIGA